MSARKAFHWFPTCVLYCLGYHAAHVKKGNEKKHVSCGKRSEDRLPPNLHEFSPTKESQASCRVQRKAEGKGVGRRRRPRAREKGVGPSCDAQERHTAAAGAASASRPNSRKRRKKWAEMARRGAVAAVGVDSRHKSARRKEAAGAARAKRRWWQIEGWNTAGGLRFGRAAAASRKTKRAAPQAAQNAAASSAASFCSRFAVQRRTRQKGQGRRHAPHDPPEIPQDFHARPLARLLAEVLGRGQAPAGRGGRLGLALLAGLALHVFLLFFGCCCCAR